jgi:hypothetical protein
MKRIIDRTKISVMFLMMLCLMTCANQDKQHPEDLEEVLQVYTVLAEKTMTEQADFDFESWSDMMAEDIEYVFPDDSVRNQTKLIGKAAVIAYWKEWREYAQIKSLTFSRFDHIPFNSSKNLNASGLAGVHVFSLCSSQWVFTNGETAVLPMNYCCHFNNDKLIDRYYVYYDRNPIVQLKDKSKHKNKEKKM